MTQIVSGLLTRMRPKSRISFFVGFLLLVSPSCSIKKHSKSIGHEMPDKTRLLRNAEEVLSCLLSKNIPCFMNFVDSSKPIGTETREGISKESLLKDFNAKGEYYELIFADGKSKVDCGGYSVSENLRMYADRKFYFGLVQGLIPDGSIARVVIRWEPEEPIFYCKRYYFTFQYTNGEWFLSSLLMR